MLRKPRLTSICETLVAIAVRTHEVKEELDEEKGNIFFEKDHQNKIEKFRILIF